jgi:hypothetical protein
VLVVIENFVHSFKTVFKRWSVLICFSISMFLSFFAFALAQDALVSSEVKNEIAIQEGAVFDQVFDEDFIQLFLKPWFPTHYFFYQPSLPKDLLDAIAAFRTQHVMGSVGTLMLDQTADVVGQLSATELVNFDQLVQLLLARRNAIRSSWINSMISDLNAMKPMISRMTCIHSEFEVTLDSDVHLRILNTNKLMVTIEDSQWVLTNGQIQGTCLGSHCYGRAAPETSNPNHIVITALGDHPDLSVEMDVTYSDQWARSVRIIKSIRSVPAASATIQLTASYFEYQGIKNQLDEEANQMDSRNGSGSYERSWQDRLIGYFDSLPTWRQNTILDVPLNPSHETVISCLNTQQAND